MRVKTSIPKEAISFVDEFDPAHSDVYKYYCPVCLRYFNHILVSNCCRTYICRVCIGAMARKAKTTTDYVIRCTHCCTDEFKLTDVDPSLPPKEYTDTPAKFRAQQSPRR